MQNVENTNFLFRSVFIIARSQHLAVDRMDLIADSLIRGDNKQIVIK